MLVFRWLVPVAAAGFMAFVMLSSVWWGCGGFPRQSGGWMTLNLFGLVGWIIAVIVATMVGFIEHEGVTRAAKLDEMKPKARAKGPTVF